MKLGMRKPQVQPPVPLNLTRFNLELPGSQKKQMLWASHLSPNLSFAIDQTVIKAPTPYDCSEDDMK